MEKLPDIRYPNFDTIRKVYQALANYLQLPSGLGEDNSYAFDVQDFTKKFNLPLLQVVYSLQAMQQASILAYQEQIFVPPTIQFLVGKEGLEEFEQMNPALELLIKTLLRTYGGILDNPISVSEKQVAWLLRENVDQIKKDLSVMHGKGIIQYDPKKETPHIRFLQNRVKAEDLYIDPVSYLKRKSAYEKRVQSMIGYMTEKSCRAQYIGRYFGDEKIVACGICDDCLEKKKTKLTREEYRTISETMKELLTESSLNALELSEKMRGISKDKIWEILDNWGNEEKIRLAPDGRITLR
jgi:ATP-dependent DNA helicase RecQ